MNKDWSETNKKMQVLLSKKDTFEEGIKLLLELRKSLFSQIADYMNCSKEDFYQMPFPKASGYHCKTLSYSIWHVFRIEDIVAHTLIQKDEQILFSGSWQVKTGASIITTGNELEGQEIVEFSKNLDVKELYEYSKAVMESTDELLKKLDYQQLKTVFTEEDRNRVIASNSVDKGEDAFWLVDYWCGKNIKGLIQMPFSRHWIMHIEAMIRIKTQLDKITAKKK